MSVLDKTRRADGGEHDGMSIDIGAARDFMATHARALDRRRFELLDGGGDPAGALAALDGYRNPDGGYGWGLEPDLRSPESQPGGRAARLRGVRRDRAATSPLAAELCDWLEFATLADGGLPFALPMAITAGCAPFWAGADATTSSLQITSVVAARASRRRARPRGRRPPVARARHRLLPRRDRGARGRPGGYVLAFCIQFLDAVHDRRPEAAGLLALGASSPTTATCPSTAAPRTSAAPARHRAGPGRAVADAVRRESIEADLDRLAGGPAGRRRLDRRLRSLSPAGKLDWRGYATVGAIEVLSANDRIPR